MSDVDPYKERDVGVREGELKLKQAQFELDKKKGPLSNIAVVVTMIVGLATAIYGALNYGVSVSQQHTAASQAQTAETEKTTALKAADIAAATARDQAGLALFVQYEDKLVHCDPALDAAQNTTVANAQISMFATLYPNLATKFQDAATATLTACSVTAANVAAAKAKAANAPPEQVSADADAARYKTLAQSGPTTVGTSTRLPTVWIQYANDGQRGQAQTLQKALIAKGYPVPGIQLVSAAPNAAQVRFYHDDQQDAAKGVADAVAGALGTPRPALRSLSGSYKNLPGGVVEFWFGR